ncbi:MAG: hypothetical protein IPH04_03495 [Saprospirales bacterium]|nr:hypothetical protein [Saprospirales bacterium]MBK6901886.1 hypothetical protein [Saprospirales bacterium]MBK7336477.1 hypothetical protein [Saprospirales bacterium]
MRRNTWKRAVAHAWLGFALLLAFYVLTFGWPDGSAPSKKGGQQEEAWEEGREPMVLGERPE